MIREYLAIAALLFVAAAFMGGELHGRKIERTKQEAARATAIEAARQTEREQQEAVNSALQTQVSELAGINAGLAGDIERLLTRPPRRVSETPRPNCEGANGPELAREHAEFLTRFAARCAEQGTALGTCYEYADAVTK